MMTEKELLIVGVEYAEERTGELFYRWWYLNDHFWFTNGAPSVELSCCRPSRLEELPLLLAMSARHFSGSQIGSRTDRFFVYDPNE